MSNIFMHVITYPYSFTNIVHINQCRYYQNQYNSIVIRGALCGNINNVKRSLNLQQIVFAAILIQSASEYIGGRIFILSQSATHHKYLVMHSALRSANALPSASVKCNLLSNLHCISCLRLKLPSFANFRWRDIVLSACLFKMEVSLAISFRISFKICRFLLFCVYLQ